MKWMLVVLITNLGHGYKEHEYPMPSFEKCLEAVATARIVKGPKGDDITFFCVAKP